jgi:asparagine synthase (glutamine-hydrolysing)
VLARDRLGIKPLYYAEVGGLVVFASELKAIAASGLVSDALDLEALAAYLTLGFVPAPRTPLAQVRKLLPGERLIVGGGRVVHERWWRYPTPPRRPEPVADADAAERLLAVLDEAVEMRLMSDVPLGAMLSGGLDSSVIVALMARHASGPVQSFSVGFAGDGRASELPDARRVAAALGAEHHELELPFGASDEELATLAWHLDEPIADVSTIGFHAVCELAAQHVTVAISGQGADEILGGYRRHLSAGLVDGWLRLPRPLRAAAAAAARRTGPGRLASLARSLQAPDPAARLLGSIGLLHPDLRGDLYDGALAEFADAAERCARAEAAAIPDAPVGEAALYLDAQLGLADHRLHYFDRTSMASSLEVRVPFLDHRVVETCAALPPGAKVRGLRGKRALRLAAEPLVPPFVLRKRKVGFFDASAARWLSGDAAGTIDRLLLAPEPRCGVLVDPAVIRRVVAEWRAGDERHTRAVLALLMLELWFSGFLARAFAAR